MTISEQAAELTRSAYIFIAKNQNKNGGFTSVTHTDHGPQEHYTVFYPALISTILAEIPLSDQTENHETIYTHLKNFWLLQPRLSGASWQTYWAVNDANYHRLKYPPDLDDSSLVLLAKHSVYPETDLSEINADYVINLTGQEQKPGGPYRTWIGCEPVPPWNDYDPIVNANIQYVLSKWNVRLQNLQTYIAHSIQTNTWRSPYYTSDYLSLYLLVRSCVPDDYPKIITIIADIITNQPPESSLDWACSIIIACRLRSPLPSGYEKKFFSIKSADFSPNPCIREQGNDESGAAALTAALWALAASELKNCVSQKNTPKSNTRESNTEDIHDKVVSVVAKKLHSLDQSLFESSLQQFCLLIQAPVAREITLLSHDVGTALTPALSEELYILLGTANLFGWLAFQWYDQCYDEKIISADLPLANICLRESANAYTEAANILGVDSKIVTEILDMVDKAHATELISNHELQAHLQSGKKVTYLPSLIASERSYGHCLGPLLIAKSMHLPEAQFQKLRRLFTHYLSTRQLCDDLHDWHEDYEAKRLTSVTRYLYMTSNIFPHAGSKQTHKIFWQDGLNQALTNVKHELQQANSVMRIIDWPEHTPTRLVSSLHRFGQAIIQAGMERKTSQALLTYYESIYEPL